MAGGDCAGCACRFPPPSSSGRARGHGVGADAQGRAPAIRLTEQVACWTGRFHRRVLTSTARQRMLRREHLLTRTLLVTVSLFAATSLTAVAQSGPSAITRPAWVGDGVSDTVWVLIEAALAESDKNRTKTMLKEAEAEARSSIVGREGEAGHRFALAVVLGLRTEREGGKTKIAIASDLKKELDVTLAIDPAHARARHLRGRLNAAVLRMS